jgi:hypothetical protein
MKHNYQIFHRKQDIGRRISALHREEILSIGMIALDSGETLARAIEQLVQNSPYPLHVIMHEDQGYIGQLRNRFPDVTFIVFSLPVSFGTMANALANECYTTFFYLIRSDASCHTSDFDQALTLLNLSEKPAVITPVLYNRQGEVVPVIQVPMLRNHLIDPIPFLPSTELQTTLYPFFGIGLYERALFQRLRGFDELVEGSYWQVLDYGLKCWLYGYPIYNFPQLSCSFINRQFIIEDRSEHEGMKRVHTRALGIRQMNGKNYPKRAGKYHDSSVHAEVKKRLALYKTDFQQLVSQWNVPQEQP